MNLTHPLRPTLERVDSFARAAEAEVTILGNHLNHTALAVRQLATILAAVAAAAVLIAAAALVISLRPRP